jgi:acyl carrier protein
MQNNDQIKIINTIRIIIAEVLNRKEEEIREDSSLNDFEVDSTDFVEISLALQEKLGEFFPLDEWYESEKYREKATFSVKSLANFIASRLNEE